MEDDSYKSIAFNCLNTWMCNREEGKYISDYLAYKNINSIGIYGYGMMGKHLIAELKDSNINVLWIMDKKDFDLPVKSVHIEDAEGLERPDLVIVTPIKGYEEIECQLREKGFEKIRGTEELVEVISSWKTSK